MIILKLMITGALNVKRDTLGLIFVKFMAYFNLKNISVFLKIPCFALIITEQE